MADLVTTRATACPHTGSVLPPGVCVREVATWWRPQPGRIAVEILDADVRQRLHRSDYGDEWEIDCDAAVVAGARPTQSAQGDLFARGGA